jgi:hypothetical protein
MCVATVADIGDGVLELLVAYVRDAFQTKSGEADSIAFAVQSAFKGRDINRVNSSLLILRLREACSHLKTRYEIGYRDGESSMQADYTFMLSEHCDPEITSEVSGSPSRLAEYIESLHTQIRELKDGTSG